METALLKTVGQIAGIGGLALGVLLILFREIIQKKIFPDLSPTQAYRVIRLIVILTFCVACLSVGSLVVVQMRGNEPEPKTQLGALKISKLELLDESSYAPDAEKGHGFINKISPRPSNEFFIRSANQLQIIILFEVEGYTTKSELETSLEGSIKLMSANGKKLSDAPIGRLTSVSKWRQRPAILNAGVQNIESYLGLESTDNSRSPIPYLTIAANFKEGEFPIGDGKIVVKIEDKLAQTSVYDELPIRIRVVK